MQDSAKTKKQLLTEQKQIKKALKESESKYRLLVDNSITGVFIIQDDKLVYVNDAYARMHGYTAPEMLGMNIFETFHPDSQQIMKQRFSDIIKGNLVAKAECRLKLRKDGQSIWVEALVSVITYEGKPAIMGNSIDATARKQAEEALTESESKYRLLAENSITGVFIIQDGKLVYVNHKYAQLHGYTAEEMIGMEALKLVHPDSVDTIKEVRKMRLSGVLSSGTIVSRGLKKDGQSIWLEASTSRVTYLGNAAVMGNLLDVTARRQAEEQLALRAKLLDSTNDSVYLHDLEGNFIYVNEAAYSKLGYTREELMSLKTYQLNIQVNPSNYHNKMAAILKKGFYTFEIPHRHKDGTVIPMEMHGRILESGGQKLVLVVGRDITERKKAEQELQLRAQMLDNSSDLIFLHEYDPETKLLYVNETMCQILNYSRQELLDMTIMELVAPEVDPPIDERQQVMDEKGNNIFESIYLRKDGTRIPVELHSRLFHVDDKKLVLANARDISRRKQSREVLKESEEKFATIFKASTNIIAIENLSTGKIIDVNDAFVRATGYRREEVIGRKTGELKLWSNINTDNKFMEDLQHNGQVYDLDTAFKSELEEKTYIMFASFINMSGERHILWEFRDISELKKLEAEKAALEHNAQVSHQLASLGWMAAGIAHEINNPLTGIMGFAELLASRQDLPENITKDLKTINDGAQRVASIVKRLLVFARQTRPIRYFLNLNELIQNTIELKAYNLMTGNIEVVTELDSALPSTVADGGQLQQVFLNLIANAETEMQQAHGKGKLLIKTEKKGKNILITFQDDGPGIAEENMDILFNPFFTTREVGKGTGLGLSICHGIVAEHGGNIWAESDLGKGATFYISLPIIAKAVEFKQPEDAAIETPAKKGLKVLAVDDEQVIRDLLSRVITEEGHQVDAVDNGKEALEKIKKESYHLILLDIKMPGMDGIEVYRNILKIDASIARRVVFVTGDVLGTDTQEFLEKTGADYITKPFNAGELKKELKRLLRA